MCCAHGLQIDSMKLSEAAIVAMEVSLFLSLET